MRERSSICAVAGWTAVAHLYQGHEWWLTVIRPMLAVFAGSAAIIAVYCYSINVSAMLGGDSPGAASTALGQAATKRESHGMNNNIGPSRQRRTS